MFDGFTRYVNGRLTRAVPARRQRALAAMAALLAVALGLAGCGLSHPANDRSRAGSNAGAGANSVPQGHPQVIEPTAGVQAAAVTETGAPVGGSDPVGDPTAHAPPIAQVQAELRQEMVAAKVTNASYINPLQYVTRWERTDQGVDANMPVGAPILAPTQIKILAIEPNWYAGQPLVYWELLAGPDAGKIQYVAEEIDNIAPPGTYLQQGQVIARYAASGTGIEFGWSTPNGVTMAAATTGYSEGQVTPAGLSIRAWLNALGANAGMR